MSNTFIDQTPSEEKVSSVDKIVSGRIRSRRNQLSLTQQNLASALGLSYQQIQKYETGSNRITAGRLYFVAKALGVHISYFFEGAESSEAEKIARALMHAGKSVKLDRRVRHAINDLVDVLVDERPIHTNNGKGDG